VPKPSVVFDTNVLISSLWRGRPWEALRVWRDGRVMMLVSSAIIDEYLEVLGRFVSADVLLEWTEALADATRVKLVEPTIRLDVIRNDPSDNRFLECALTGQASAIVSGDRHLLALNAFRAIPILTPAEFLDVFG
jgi:putative PIN family toxin of toxin-antitoxin system